MNKLSKNLPTLDEIINEIGSLCESGGKYEEAPHIIDVLLPTVCSYLNYWWFKGPSAKAIQSEAALKIQLKNDKSSKTTQQQQQQQQHQSQPKAQQANPTPHLLMANESDKNDA